MGNDFEKMYQRQAEFQRLVYPEYDFDNLTVEQQIELTREMILHLQSEAVEFMNEMAWKAKRRQSPHIVRGNLLDEAVDVVKMAMTLPIVWGFTAEEFVEAFMDKSMVVEQRYQQEFPLYEIIKQAERKGQPSVVALDIDGVLADWPFCFYKFVEQEHPGELCFRLMHDGTSTEEVTPNPYEALANPPLQVGRWKDEYRQSGVKRQLDVIAGAVDFTHQLRGMGLNVVLLTARPYRQYSRTFADTMYWLDSNGFAYDAILWADNKEQRLAEEFSPQSVVAFVDDDDRNVERVRQSGFNAFLFKRSYNDGITFNDILGEVGWIINGGR